VSCVRRHERQEIFGETAWNGCIAAPARASRTVVALDLRLAATRAGTIGVYLRPITRRLFRLRPDAVK